MTIFGAPHKLEYDTFYAIKTAVEMQRVIEKSLIREIDTVVVKGRKASITLYEVMCEKLDPQWMNLLDKKDIYEEALRLYRSCEFKRAGVIFASIKTDKVSKLFKDRCETYLKQPPNENWNGIYEMSKK